MNKFYITTSIAYANAKPHIGHALEFVQADVVARYQRLSSKEVKFLTGTDEHGTKIFRAAKELDKSPKRFVDGIVAEFQKLDELLEISNDDFIRTTDKDRHWPSVAKLWQRLLIAEDIYKKNYKGLYCVGHEAFIKETELIDGVCPDHKTKPETIEEENYFFRLSKYGEKLERLIESNELKVIPEFRKNEVLSLIKQGLEDVSFSRPTSKLDWGIPVPGDDSQTIYVWADALTNYLSAIGYGTDGDEFRKFWPADVHFIGKDILRFHALIWPAMLLSADLPLPKILFVHGHILSGGQKMSKTIGNVIDPFEIIEKYGAEALRYFLLREIPPVQDGDFTIEKFEARYRADLVNGLGNLVNRVLTLTQKHPELVAKDGEFKEVKERTETIWKKYQTLLDEFKFNEASEEIWSLVRYGNEYVDRKKLWELAEKDVPEFSKAITELLLYLANIAALLEPFLPSTAEKIFKQLGINPKSDKQWVAQLTPKRGRVLFTKLENRTS